MNMKLDIKPYLGVGDVRFGMKPDEVAKFLGPPDRIRTSTMLKERVELRSQNGLQATFSRTDIGLIEIGFSPNILDLRFKDIKVFEDVYSEVLRRLISEDGNPVEYLGTVVLLNLGISLAKDDDEDKTLSVFAKGRWDSMKEKLKPFEFKS